VIGADLRHDLVIADQWTEPHSPRHTPAELNGVTNLKSDAQVLIDRTGAPDIVDLFLTCYPRLS
jgi:hypothetical protein